MGGARQQSEMLWDLLSIGLTLKECMFNSLCCYLAQVVGTVRVEEDPFWNLEGFTCDILGW